MKYHSGGQRLGGNARGQEARIHPRVRTPTGTRLRVYLKKNYFFM